MKIIYNHNPLHVDEKGRLSVFIDGAWHIFNRIRETENKEYLLGFNQKYVNKNGW